MVGGRAALRGGVWGRTRRLLVKINDVVSRRFDDILGFLCKYGRLVILLLELPRVKEGLTLKTSSRKVGEVHQTFSDLELRVGRQLRQLLELVNDIIKPLLDYSLD
jgi:hypothetical protein